MRSLSKNCPLFFLSAVILFACNGNSAKPSKELIGQLQLKSGELISCGSLGKEFGTLDFETGCSEATKNDFNTAVELLHSFEYAESEKVFAKIIDASPECAMAYWGVAMCNFHPLWEPPTEPELKKGAKAIEIARSITGKTERESGYIDAVAAYYDNWGNTELQARAIHFEKAMEQLYKKYPEDKETAIFYALALVASAQPTDKTYANQKKAGAILNALYAEEPNHPGIVHYIIHTYDYPAIANLGLPAARRYAKVARSSAHALHMPSHIFTRLGYWDDCTQSNAESVAAAQCYAKSAGIKGHWDEELHGLDYLVYAYLQKGDNGAARQQLEYMRTITKVYPVNFKGAYAFAAIPSRIVLENRNWQEATTLQLHQAGFPWDQFPWQEAIIHFTRLLGAVHINNIELARSELLKLNQLHDTLVNRNNMYNAGQVAIQIKAGEAWIKFIDGNKTEALNLMKAAANTEDSTSKHPVTPGEVLPARELYADMVLQANQPENALLVYEEVLQNSPNRFNSLYGAAEAAERSGNLEKAVVYYKQLSFMASPGSNRPELAAARSFLKKHQ